MYKIFDILLNVILEEILPISKISVSNGNKIFGAAILNKNDLSIIVIGANNEVLNPINHGEIVTINDPTDSEYLEIEVSFIQSPLNQDFYLIYKNE